MRKKNRKKATHNKENKIKKNEFVPPRIHSLRFTSLHTRRKIEREPRTREIERKESKKKQPNENSIKIQKQKQKIPMEMLFLSLFYLDSFN